MMSDNLRQYIKSMWIAFIALFFVFSSSIFMYYLSKYIDLIFGINYGFIIVIGFVVFVFVSCAAYKCNK